jgi:hypothetical protein
MGAISRIGESDGFAWYSKVVKTKAVGYREEQMCYGIEKRSLVFNGGFL